MLEILYTEVIQVLEKRQVPTQLDTCGICDNRAGSSGTVDNDNVCVGTEFRLVLFVAIRLRS